MLSKVVKDSLRFFGFEVSGESGGEDDSWPAKSLSKVESQKFELLNNKKVSRMPSSRMFENGTFYLNPWIQLIL